MLAEQDIRTLHAAGIDDIESLAAAAAAFLREHPIYSIIPMPNALSDQEEAFLRQGGAAGVGRYDASSATRNVTSLAAEYAQMVSTAYTQKEVAERLGVSTSRVRQRIDGGSLYSIPGPGGRVCPRWQFSDSATLPGLEQVLATINIDAHPVAVQRFFLTETADLESDSLMRALSPRDWLLTGHPAEAVALLARDL
jgi:hypothetical protein